jgi:predicted dehydrogenase
MIQIGIAGANELSKKHIEKILEIKDFRLVGFYDHDEQSSEYISNTFGLKKFDSYADLLANTQAIDILSPVGTHYKYALKAIESCRHVFVDKVLSENLDEAKELANLAYEANIQLHVSRYERFHPNFQLLKKLLNNPLYIESSKFDQHIINLSPEDLVFDLLLNELELVLNIVKANVLKVRTTAACMHSDTVDFINVRLEFDNGCVYNMVGGSFKSEQRNKIRFFQKNKTYGFDLTNFRISLLNSSDEVNEAQEEQILRNTGKNTNEMIKRELEYFAQNITHQSLQLRTYYDNYQAIEVAHRIIADLQKHKR